MKYAFLVLTLAVLFENYSAGAVCSDSNHPGVIALAMRDTINADDPISFRWWLHLRDTIDKSSRYCLLGKKDESNSYVVLSVTALDTDRKHFAYDTAAVTFAAYFTSNTVFIGHWLHLCGAGTVDFCAESALAEFEHELDSVPPAVRPKE